MLNIKILINNKIGDNILYSININWNVTEGIGK